MSEFLKRRVPFLRQASCEGSGAKGAVLNSQKPEKARARRLLRSLVYMFLVLSSQEKNDTLRLGVYLHVEPGESEEKK